MVACPLCFFRFLPVFVFCFLRQYLVFLQTNIYSMALIDILILVLVIVGGAYGFYKGLVSGIGGLIGLVVGIIACRLFGSTFSDAIVEAFPGAEHYIAVISAYIIIFLVFFFGIKLVALLLKQTLKALSLGGFDRIGGAILGIFKWLLLLSVILNGLYIIAPNMSLFHSSHLLDGKIFEFVMRIAPWAWGVDIFPSSVG